MFQDPVSSLSHLFGAVFFLGAGISSVIKGRGNASRVTSLIVFTFALVFLHSMSGVYHLLERDGVARAVMQRLDHSAIWVLIAGTFTPIHVILFRRFSRWLMLTIIWTIAITGLVLEVVFFTSFPEWLLVSLFIGLGWMGAFSMVRFKKIFGDPSIRLLIGGGVSYTIGAVLDFLKWPVLMDGYVEAHEIFHLFVLAGAYQHWKFIHRWADHPVQNTILVNIHSYLGHKFLACAVSERLQAEAASLEGLKFKIQEIVRKRFHSTIEPVVHLRYFQDEILPMSSSLPAPER